jgi:hypothetical protein
MNKWLAVVVACLLAVGGYVAAGPYLTVRAIRAAIQQQDAAALSEQVDFPALRSSLKRQLATALTREAGPELQASPFGAFALRLAGGVVDGAVDGMVTPGGLGAVMEGRKVWHKASDDFTRDDFSGAASGQAQRRPLDDARYRFESPSRFTATVRTDDGAPLVFVLTRGGLRWRLSDIRLPLGDEAGTH